MRPDKLAKDLVGDWQPSKGDVEWLRALVRGLRVGGRWVSPALGSVFEKTGENELTLKRFMLDVRSDHAVRALANLEKLRRVARAAGIKLNLEKSAEYGIVIL